MLRLPLAIGAVNLKSDFIQCDFVCTLRLVSTGGHHPKLVSQLYSVCLLAWNQSWSHVAATGNFVVRWRGNPEEVHFFDDRVFRSRVSRDVSVTLWRESWRVRAHERCLPDMAHNSFSHRDRIPWKTQFSRLKIIEPWPILTVKEPTMIILEVFQTNLDKTLVVLFSLVA